MNAYENFKAWIINKCVGIRPIIHHWQLVENCLLKTHLQNTFDKKEYFGIHHLQVSLRSQKTTDHTCLSLLARPENRFNQDG